MKPTVDCINVEAPSIASCAHFSGRIVPATRIIDFCNSHHRSLFPKEKLNFCYYTVLKAIDSFLIGRYTDFDGHTTSNCCHGMAVLTLNVIYSVLELDIHRFREEGEEKIKELGASTEKEQLCTWWIPEALFELSCLYILGLVKESDPVKGGRTSTKRLKAIAPISTNVCNQVAHDLQKQFANLVADGYAFYAEEVDEEMEVSGVPVKLWSKYIQPDQLRVDKRGVKYASNLFSMQVSFAYLSYSRAKVALINDILDTSGVLKDRYVALFEGDGNGGFRVLSSREIHLLSLVEPIVVYSGCSYSDHLDKDSFSVQVQPWLNKLSNLLLACDVFYPQFFKVVDDPEFNSNPIIPDEDFLKKIIDVHLNTRGVSKVDPFLYCATHIYPASLAQVIQVQEGNKKTLPISFIPGVKCSNNVT